MAGERPNLANRRQITPAMWGMLYAPGEAAPNYLRSFACDCKTVSWEELFAAAQFNVGTRASACPSAKLVTPSFGHCV